MSACVSESVGERVGIMIVIIRLLCYIMIVIIRYLDTHTIKKRDVSP